MRDDSEHQTDTIDAGSLTSVLSAGLIFLATIIVIALVVTGVGIFMRMWQLRRR